MAETEIITFGCRLNAFESEVIRRAAATAGLTEAVIVNTCAVTAEAERQARQAIRRARRRRPGARIIVTGCAAEIAPERYAALPEVDRLRLSSLDPAEIDAELWRLLAEERRLMPHLHLSLQAGDDLILKRMKRRHSRAQAIAVARRARALRPEVAIGADLIAGFPTETEEMFRHSLDIVGGCGIALLHVFPYSPR